MTPTLLGRRMFHEHVTTWFKGQSWPPAPVPPPATTVPERQALLGERDREQGRWAEEQRGYERRRAAAAERLTEARALVCKAEARVAECEAEALTASLDSGIRVTRLEGRMRAGASEHIRTFLRDTQDQLEVLRGPGVVGVAERWDRRDPYTGERAHRFISNSASVERRRAALAAAYRAAEALALEALDEEAIVERLTALRDGIPEVEEFLVEMPDLFSPAEHREIAWRLAEQAEASR